MIQNVNIVFAGFIIAVCLTFAYFAAFTDVLDEKLAGNNSLFTGLMLVYAAYRSYRIVKAFKERNKENQE